MWFMYRLDHEMELDKRPQEMPLNAFMVCKEQGDDNFIFSILVTNIRKNDVLFQIMTVSWPNTHSIPIFVSYFLIFCHDKLTWGVVIVQCGILMKPKIYCSNFCPALKRNLADEIAHELQNQIKDVSKSANYNFFRFSLATFWQINQSRVSLCESWTFRSKPNVWFVIVLSYQVKL